MAERVDQLIPYGYAETWIGTFHAFGDSVLREGALEAGLNPEFRVLTRPEQIIFLRERLWRLPLERFRPLGDPTRHLVALLTLVSRAKDEDVSPAAYRAWAEKRAGRRRGPGGGRRRRAARASWPPSTRATRSCWARRARSTSATRSRRPWPCCARGPRCWPSCARATATSWWTSSRTRTTPSSSWCAWWPNPEAPEHHGGGGRRPGHLPLARRRGGATSSPSASSTRTRAQVVLTENHRSTQVILDAAARLISYNNPYRLEVIAGHRQAPALRAQGRGRRCATSTSTPCPRRPTAWRR